MCYYTIRLNPKRYGKLMTRMSKQGERRAVSHRRRRPIAQKTGPKKDQLEFGYKVHVNGLDNQLNRFIPKVR